jgi:hypothetical protein
VIDFRSQQPLPLLRALALGDVVSRTIPVKYRAP